MCVFAYVIVCIPYTCLGLRSPGSGVTDGCEPMWVLGIESSFLQRAANALYHQAILPAPSQIVPMFR